MPITKQEICYRTPGTADILKLSVLYKQVYIHTYGREGVSAEFANFIDKQFSTERIGSMIADTPENLIVATYKNNLVGVAEIDFKKQCPLDDRQVPELSKLYILDWFCGIGIGYRLLQEAEKAVLAKGVRDMWLWVLKSNQRAVSFYERQQYKTIGNAELQLETNRYDNWVMWKSLE